ncbi:MAG: DUF4139 domain-containing protein [Planctomycetota bacterium]
MLSTRVGMMVVLAGSAVGLTNPAIGESDLPVNRITLYRSGVGYFEHTGTVTGDDAVRLRFDVNKINDILKSLVAFDFDGGRIDGVHFAPKEPLSQKLDNFNFRLEDSIVKLLAQFRGERVKLSTPHGDVEGIIYGTEQRSSSISVDNGVQHVNDWFVTVVTSSGIRAVAQSEIRSFELLDEELAQELNRALMTVATHRNDDLSDIEVRFEGDGERDVAISYTLESPVWKTSYRLVLPDETGGEPYMQGWAIVENATDEDWNDVELSLAAGRPVSFTMDLQLPLFLSRPHVPVPVIGGLAPTLYESARNLMPGELAEGEYRRDTQVASEMAKALGRSRGQREVLNQAGAMADMAAPSAARFELDADDWVSYGGGSRALAGEAGEQFFFTMEDPVSIERHASSMIPILGTPIEGRRITIYSPQTGNDLPMRGVDMRNDTGMQLMAGPIAVFDGGRYAGDSQIRNTARNQDRLLSYAVDSEVKVLQENDSTSTIRKIKIVDGLLWQEYRGTQTTTYTITNYDGDEGRTVLLERAPMHGWELLAPEEPSEETDTMVRFEVEVPANDSVEYDVTYERVYSQSIGLTDMSMETLLRYSRNGRVSQQVIDAVSKAAKMQAQINRLGEQIAAIEKDRTEVFQDQDRIRRNMSSVGRNSDLWTRYSRKLGEQETELERIDGQLEQARAQRAQLERDLKAYLMDLDVD